MPIAWIGITASVPPHSAGIRAANFCLRPRVIVYQQSDWELVQRYRCGDRAAFSELMTRYQRPVYNAAYGVLHRVEDAKDITQDVFLKVAERLNEYDPQFKFFSWLYRIALNESLNLQRRNHRNDAAMLSTRYRRPRAPIRRNRRAMSSYRSGYEVP